MNGSYHPIRQKAAWVATIQTLVTALILAGVAADVVQGWAAVAVAVLDVLVVVGALSVGVVKAEHHTTPVGDDGRPLNPEYVLAQTPNVHRHPLPPHL